MRDPLSVLIIAQYFPPDLGGSATRAYNVAKGLLLNGCRVTVVAAFPHYPHGNVPKEYRWRPFKEERIGNMRVIRTFILPLESKGLGRRIALFVTFIVSSLFPMPLVGKFDVVWSSNPDLIAIIPAIIYGAVKKRPIASNVDDLALEDLYDLKLIKRGSIAAKVIELITRTCYRKAALITPISPGYVKPLLQYGVEKSKIHVVKGGVDLTIFKPCNSALKNEDQFTVLYSGAFSIAYNFDQVIYAAKIVEEKDDEIEFILQGKGELVNHIKSKIKDLNLKNLQVIDRIISREEVAKLLNQANALILPLGDFGKPHLGISAKLYEYQAMGKPIICCSSGVPGTYVQETKSGVVVRPGDYNSLTEFIFYLKHNKYVAKELGKNGRRYVENNVSLEKIGFEMMTILEKIAHVY